jgi:hypothetical protein
MGFGTFDLLGRGVEGFAEEVFATTEEVYQTSADIQKTTRVAYGCIDRDKCGYSKLAPSVFFFVLTAYHIRLPLSMRQSIMVSMPQFLNCRP